MGQSIKMQNSRKQSHNINTINNLVTWWQSLMDFLGGGQCTPKNIFTTSESVPTTEIKMLVWLNDSSIIEQEFWTKYRLKTRPIISKYPGVVIAPNLIPTLSPLVTVPSDSATSYSAHYVLLAHFPPRLNFSAHPHHTPTPQAKFENLSMMVMRTYKSINL
jgi:hypothetical protein